MALVGDHVLVEGDEPTFMQPNKADWDQHQKLGIDGWNGMLAKLRNKETSLVYDPNLVACINASIQKIDWEAHLASCRSRSFTFIHRDCHAGNVFWVPTPNSASATVPADDITGSSIGKCLLLDWEMCGVGNGPEDIMWYLVFHMDPALRRQCESRILKQYYDTLTQSRGPSDTQSDTINTDTYTYDEFMKEYLACGSGRLMYIMGFACDLTMPVETMQRFIDLVAAMIKDHDITPENVDMFRPT